MPREAVQVLKGVGIAHAMVVVGVVLFGGAAAAEAPPRLVAPAAFEEEAVASDSAIASEVGARVLADGGNAVDAAVATALALAVVHPAAGNLGGGGFLVVAIPDGGARCFDFRETAPARATEGMFLDASGAYVPARHHEGILSVGVPGSVAGLRLAHERLGRLPWRRLVEPAVELAARGFRVGPGLSRSIAEELPRLRPYPGTLAIFAREGRPPRPGDRLIQADLARTLERIRDLGAAGFYEGETARLLVAEMERRGGLVGHEDLRAYRAIERSPLRGSYRGFEVIGMPPPSSGGIAVLQVLGMLEGHDLAALGHGGSRASHLLIEALRRAFADRARHVGDPDFTEVPVDRLISREHVEALRRSIDPARASRSSPETFAWPAEGSETTHLSVVDRDAMAVALTTTLEQNYGSCIVVEGAGFLLNDEMGDFNPRAGLTTRQGLIGTPPNLVRPGKRMLSSMSPTIVRKDARPVLVVGSPGGRTIISTVLQVIVNVLDHGMSVQEAIDQPRLHHQWLPDEVLAEPRCFSPDTLRALETMGHAVRTRDGPQGSAMAIAIVRGADGSARLEAGVDRRRADGGAAGR